MPVKSKKIKSPPADDFDEIIAQFAQFDASRTATVTSSGGGSNAKNARSRSSSTNRAGHTEQQAEWVISQMCIDGNLDCL
jgi:hypothetical protein